MTINNIQLLQVGRAGANPQKLIIDTDNTIAEVTTAGYLSSNAQFSGIQFSNKQLAEVYTTDGKVGVYQVSVDSDGIASLSANTDGIVVLPVVSGNIPKFDGTSGVLEDSGISPSNAAKTKVVMANGAVTVNYIAKYTDTSGTVGQAAGAAYNLGDIHAGISGTTGALISHAPTSAKGSLVTQAADNAADYTVTVTNREHSQNSTHYIPSIGAATSDFLLTTIVGPDANINLVAFDVTVSAAALAGGASVTLYTSFSPRQYKIRSLWVNSGGTNFSGGGGDRLLSITDNTTVYSLVPAASLQTLANTGWGVTGLPFPASAAINTSTAAGASLVAKYSGGSADYAAGSVVISGVLQRVA